MKTGFQQKKKSPVTLNMFDITTYRLNGVFSYNWIVWIVRPHHFILTIGRSHTVVREPNHVSIGLITLACHPLLDHACSVINVSSRRIYCSGSVREV